MKDAWNWHERRMKCTWKMHEIDMKDAWNWHERRMKCTWKMHEIDMNEALDGHEPGLYSLPGLACSPDFRIGEGGEGVYVGSSKNTIFFTSKLRKSCVFSADSKGNNQF